MSEPKETLKSVPDIAEEMPGNVQTLEQAIEESDVVTAGGDLENQRAQFKFDTHSLLLRNINRAAVIVIWVVALIGIAGIIVWAIHLMTSFGWLSPQQINKIETMLLSGAASGVLVQYIKRKIDE